MNKPLSSNELNLRNIFPSIIKLGSFYFLSTVILSFSAFIFWLIVANKFSTQLYGEIRTIFAIASIISAFFQFGLFTYTQLIISQNEFEKLSYVIPLKIFFLFLYLLASLLYFLLNTNSFNFGLFILLTGVVLVDDVIRFFFSIYYGKENFYFIFKSSILSRVILISLVIILYAFGNIVFLFIYALLFVNVIQAIHLIYGFKFSGIQIPRPDFNLKEYRNLFIIIMPLGLNNLFNLLYDKIDIPIISYFLGFQDVAEYSIAYSSFTLSGLIFSFFYIVFLNYFSRSGISKKNLKKLFKQSFVFIFTTSFLISILFVLFGKFIILLLFGEKYIFAGEILPYFGLAIILWGLNGLTGIFLNAQKQFKATMVAVFIGLIVNISLDILTIPYLGIIGGVIATTATALVVLIIELYFILKLELLTAGKLS